MESDEVFDLSGSDANRNINRNGGGGGGDEDGNSKNEKSIVDSFKIGDSTVNEAKIDLDAHLEVEAELDAAATTSTADHGVCASSPILDWVCTIIIGFLVVSYWRGTWTLFDIYLCNQPQDASMIDANMLCFVSDLSHPVRIRSAWISYGIGMALLIVGIILTWCGVWFLPPGSTLGLQKGTQRIALLYILGAATVNIWRAIWYLTDAYIFVDSYTYSLISTTILGALCCFVISCGGSLLAPPALFLLDGPGYSSPPIVGSILETYYEIVLPDSAKLPNHRTVVKVIDLIMTYILLPIFVVWFWRGCWGILDTILWGFTPNQSDLHLSLGYGALIAAVGLFICSTNAMLIFPHVSDSYLTQVLKRIRVLLLAVSTVSFWRVVWYVWDEFLGQGALWSAWVSHFVGVLGLLCMGCMSCITAPPTTVGVDAILHPESAEEPLLHDEPIPAESIKFFSICRQPVEKRQAVVDYMSSSFPTYLPPQQQSSNATDLEELHELSQAMATRRYSLQMSISSMNSFKKVSRQTIPRNDFVGLSKRSSTRRDLTVSLTRNR